MLNIEEEGFVFKVGWHDNQTKAYTKPYENNTSGYFDEIVVFYNEKDDWVRICIGDTEELWCDWDVVFSGRIHTQEDFKKMLEMVIV